MTLLKLVLLIGCLANLAIYFWSGHDNSHLFIAIACGLVFVWEPK